MNKWIWRNLAFCLSLLVAACGSDGGDPVEPEVTPPSPVLSTHPPGNATDVPLDVVVTATFREDMDSSSIADTTFTLEYNPFVSGTVTYDKGTRIATFTPDSLLTHSTTYTATITTGAKDSSGTQLATPVSWNFMTIIPGKAEVRLPRTGQIASYGTGDDGNFEVGVAWPTPRFVDNNDGTITDQLTGLMWLKDGECLGFAIWQGALYQAVDSLNFDPASTGCQDYAANYHDWRVPNVNELESLINAGQAMSSSWLNGLGFTGVRAHNYWSSSTFISAPLSAWTVNLWAGAVDPNEKRFYNAAWAVRGVTDAPAPIWKTGQVTSYRPGDDGDLQVGSSWPRPRFFFTSNSKTTDLLTGLMWMRDADAPSIGTCTGGLKTWQEALDYIACLNSYNYEGSSDWRLPNRKELFSLIDRSQRYPALPSDHYFVNVQYGYYWTSTTYAMDRSRAWVIDTADGDMGPRDKTGNARVWPVRGGR